LFLENTDYDWPKGEKVLVTGGAGYIGSHTVSIFFWKKKKKKKKSHPNEQTNNEKKKKKPIC
jgi:UDP-glucose 4-epimerase